MPETLVLWDVDMTLLDLRRVGGDWFNMAIRDVTGRDPVHTPSFGGRTDRWIAARFLDGMGLTPTDELIGAVHAAVVRNAAAQRHRIAELGVVLPGVPAVLAALAERDDMAQTLVTGNLRTVAGFKVDAFDLGRYLDLEIGGYGESSEVRSVLVADALTGAGLRHGRDFVAESVVVVGDTPHDVAAALAHGARAVAVATGRFGAAELADAGAHAVLPNLADLDRVLATIAGAAPRLP